MVLDPREFASSSTMNPAANAEEITPADVDMTQRSRAIYVGTTGDLTVKMSGAGAAIVTFANVLGGTLLPIRCDQVRSTLTTATDIVALF